MLFRSEVQTHTNETMAGLQRQVTWIHKCSQRRLSEFYTCCFDLQILRQLKQQNHLNSNFKLDLCYNGDIINVSDDRQVVHVVGLRDKMVSLSRGY